MVKRYDIDADGHQVETLDGFFVTYTDHAALAARLAIAVAALDAFANEEAGCLKGLYAARYQIKATADSAGASDA